MNQVIEISLYILFSVVFAIILASYVASIFKIRSLTIKLAQIEIDKHFLQNKLQEMIDKKENKNIEHTEGFIRFVSDSRNMAFEYIENVQAAISELKEYFDENGLLLNLGETDEMAKRIEKVISYLPEDTKND